MARLNSAQLARRAGISQSAVSQALAKGQSKAQILKRAAVRKATGAVIPQQKHQKHKQRGPKVGAPRTAKDWQGNDLTREDAELRKAISLAEKNAIEVAKMKGELAPVGPMVNYFAGLVIKATEIWTGMEDILDRIAEAPTREDRLKLFREEYDRGLEELRKYGKYQASLEGNQVVPAKQIAGEITEDDTEIVEVTAVATGPKESFGEKMKRLRQAKKGKK